MTPAIAAVALAIVGFCNVLVKLCGPVEEYVAPDIVLAVKLIAPPTQTRTIASSCRS